MPSINSLNVTQEGWSEWSNWQWDDQYCTKKRQRYNLDHERYEFQLQRQNNSTSTPRILPAPQNAPRISPHSHCPNRYIYSHSDHSVSEPLISRGNPYPPQESRGVSYLLPPVSIEYTEYSSGPSNPEPSRYPNQRSIQERVEPSRSADSRLMHQRSESEHPYNKREKNRTTILISDKQHQELRAHVLLDSGSEDPNGLYISYQLVIDLGLADEIDSSGPRQSIPGADGHAVSIMGAIQLTWRVPGGGKFHTNRFQIIDKLRFDAIFGFEFMEKNGMLDINTSSLCPLGVAESESPEAEQNRLRAQWEQARLAREAKEKRERKEWEKRNRSYRPQSYH